MLEIKEYSLFIGPLQQMAWFLSDQQMSFKLETSHVNK